MLENRIKVMIAEKKIQHGDFAKDMNVSRNTVSNWIGGKTNPSLEEAFEIAEYFGVSITDIWQIKKPPA